MASVKVARGRDVLEIDESKIADAQARGYEPVTEDDAAQIQRTKDAATVVGGARGQVEAAASTATFGLTDLAATKVFGADEKALAARREGSEVGAFLGAVAPAVLSGGTGAVGAIARATPAGIAGRAGVRIARGRGVAGAIAGNAVEGMAQGVGEVITEHALGGPEISGERVFHGMAKGGGIGAAFGLGFGIGGKAIGGVGRAAGGVTRRAGDALAGGGPKVSKATKDKVLDLWAGATSADRDALGAVVEATGTKEGRRIVLAGPAALDASRQKLATSLKGGVDASNDAWDGLIAATGGQARGGNAERLMSAAERKASPGQARAFIDGEAARIKQMGADDLLTDSARRDLKESMRAAARAKEAIEEAAEDGGKAFRAIDKYRQELRVIREARHAEYARTASPETGRSVANMDDLLKKARAHTTDESVYGDAAKAHAEDLDGWAQAIEATTELRKKSPALGKLFERGASDVDIAPLVTLAGGRARGASKASAFDEVIDKRLRAVEILKRNHDLPPEVRAKITEFDRATKAMRSEMDKNAEVARVVDALYTVRQTGESGFSPSNVGAQGASAIGGALGFGLGGLPGAILGGIAGAATRPFTTLRWLAGAREMVDKIRLRESGVIAGVGKLIDGVKSAARPAARAVGAGARRAVTSEAVRSQEDRKRQLLKVRDSVNEMVADPMQMAERFRDDDAFAEAPTVAKMRMITAARAVSYLKGVEPKTYRPHFAGGVEIVDPVQLAAYERAVEAVVDPDGTTERLMDGMLTLDHARALAAVYPQKFEMMRMAVLDELGARERLKQPVAYRARVQLGIILGMPLDDSMRPGWATAPTAPMPTQAPGAPATARPSAEISRPTAGLDRIEAGGERI